MVPESRVQLQVKLAVGDLEERRLRLVEDKGRSRGLTEYRGRWIIEGEHTE